MGKSRNDVLIDIKICYINPSSVFFSVHFLTTCARDLQEPKTLPRRRVHWSFGLGGGFHLGSSTPNPDVSNSSNLRPSLISLAHEFISFFFVAFWNFSFPLRVYIYIHKSLRYANFFSLFIFGQIIRSGVLVLGFDDELIYLLLVVIIVVIFL